MSLEVSQAITHAAGQLECIKACIRCAWIALQFNAQIVVIFIECAGRGNSGTVHIEYQGE